MERVLVNLWKASCQESYEAFFKQLDPNYFNTVQIRDSQIIESKHVASSRYK